MRNSSIPIADFIVHTGQHYDDEMSKVFFDELEIPRPSTNLAVGSGTHGVQTARMLEGIEGCLIELKPDVVMVYGDTNSTLAGSLAAAKLNIPVVHIEAGLRSYNRIMPEELNRIVTDHLSAVLCAPTSTAMKNLATEGLLSRAVLTGDVMYDAVVRNASIARQRSDFHKKFGLASNSYGLVTIHRAENTAPAQLKVLLDRLNAAGAKYGPIIFPLHPRTAAAIRANVADWQPHDKLRLIPPLGYLDMLCAVAGARFVLTDSGGLQKEAYFLGRPCVTLRNETEWLETVEAGANVIVGSDGHSLMDVLAATEGRSWEERDLSTQSDETGPFGNGNAALEIVKAVLAIVRH
jgi:UDP-N-acetylglucosamine 2-epimerase